MKLPDRIYAKSPLRVQNTLVSLYGFYWHWLRFGGRYSTYEREYRSREGFSQQQWQQYQAQKLVQLLTNAATEIPYYARTWTDPQKQAAFNGDIQALPLLDKEPLRNDPYDFVAPGNQRQHHWTFLTSGSTGTPISTLWTKDEIRESLAVREVRSAGWAGVSFTMPRATFSGRMVEPDPNSKGPFYRFNSAERQVYFSPFHLRAETAHFYVEALNKHKIQWMTGYAVSYYLLARFILEQQLEVPPIKAVITTSEKLTPEMRRVMEKAFSCRVFEEYSTVENAIFASECEQGRLHLSPDVSLVEILRPDGTACAPGEVGEVVVTCLMRPFQPLIRFRLGDLAAWDSEPCPCGRQMPIIKEVVGRVEDVVVGPDGRQMVRFHGVFVGQPHLLEGQIIQQDLNHITVKVVPLEGFGEADIDDIKQRVRQRLGNEVQVEVIQVSEIPRTKSGKFQAVISNLPMS